MDDKTCAIIEERIGYKFQNRMLLQQAFVRRSYTNEYRKWQNNEVLEFIGDKVLDVLVVKALAQFHGSVKDSGEFVSALTEGKLTEIKKRLIEKPMLAHRIEMLGLKDFLIMGKSDVRNNAQDDDSVKEDLFESILGAAAIDCDWDFSVLEDLVEQMLDIEFYLENGFDSEENYTDLIQQWCQKESGELPRYSYRELHLPFYSSSNRLPLYSCELTIPNVRVQFQGRGNSKSAARLAAASEAYRYLDQNGMLFSMEDEIGEPTLERAVSQLQELSQKGYIEMPEYTFASGYDKDGNQLWRCECSVKGVEHSYVNTEFTKKEAKRASAYEMLLFVLGYDSEDEEESDDEEDDWD